MKAINKQPKYGKEVKEIRAIALSIAPKELTTSSLAKAMLIAENGRKILSKELEIKECFLQIPFVKVSKNVKDDPTIKWPAKFNDSDDSDSFLKSLDLEDLEDVQDDNKSPDSPNENHDSESEDLLGTIDTEDEQNSSESPEQKEIEITDLKTLAEKLIEEKGKGYFIKKLLANTEEEFLELIRSAKIKAGNDFPGFISQIDGLLTLIELQYIQNYKNDKENNPNPIFIFSNGDNNDFELLNSVTQMLECDAEFLHLDLEWGSEFTKVFENRPPLLAIFHFSNIIANNVFFDKLISYYETGITPIIKDNEGDHEGWMSSIFDDYKTNEEINLKKIVNHNIIIFLVKIPEGIININGMPFEEISFSLQKYYQRKFQETAQGPINYIRLFQLAKNYNTVVFRNYEYTDVVELVRIHIGKLGVVDLRKIPENKLRVFANLIILLAGGLKNSYVVSSINYFFAKTEISCLELQNYSFDIDCNLDYLKGFLKITETDLGNQLIDYQSIFSDISKSNKHISYSISTNHIDKSIVVNDFKEYISPTGENVYLQERPNIRFKDVIGLRGIKKRFAALGEYYKNPGLFKQLKIMPNNRILLTGEPGTGKTFITKAFAGEMGIPFFYVSAAELTSQKYAGYGGSLLRDIFQTAKTYKPCILFFDELDTFGNRENMGGDSVGFDAKSIINTLLVELDGINSQNDIIVVGATNRPQDIDVALTRPKRFGTILTTDGFTLQDRKELVKKELPSEMCLDSYDELLKNIIERTNNDFTPVIIEEIIIEAKLNAINNNRAKITLDDINIAIDNQVFGHKINEVDPALKNTMAYHQAGHALLHKVFFGEKNIEKLSVSIYENSIGIMRVKEDDSLIKQYSMEELIKMIIVQMGGAVVEEVKYGSWGLIAEEDWEFVSMVATRIIGNIVIGKNLKPIIEYYLSPDTLAESNAILIEKLITFCFNIAKEIVEENRIDIELLAKKLIENGELTGKQIDKILININQNSRNLFEEFKAEVKT